MNPKAIFSIVLALAGIFFSNRASRSFFEAQAASPPIGPANPDEANAKLEKAIKTMFERDEHVRKADLSVRADITKNEVTLFGMVESEAVRSKAVELTKTAHVGVIVNDKMTVKPERPSAHGPDH
jgi:osmotically-inducible protein OsmY